MWHLVERLRKAIISGATRHRMLSTAITLASALRTTSETTGGNWTFKLIKLGFFCPTPNWNILFRGVV